MRKQIKYNIIEMIKTMYEAHSYIKVYTANKDREQANIILVDCQQAAIQLGTLIEESEGEETVTISYLEDYCEAVYDVAMNATEKKLEMLNDKLARVERSVICDIKESIEVLFLPYKASMWDSMESIWRAAVNDPECEVFVVPIPYYDRNTDRSFGDYHYEGKDYPEYVPVIYYEEYNIKEHRPDIIFIHNPYDNCNYVTSVDTRFYSAELKKYTECLVYVPYYLFPKKLEDYSLVFTPVLYNADVIIAQNEEVKDAYVCELKRLQAIRGNRQCAVMALGTPKTDKIIHISRNGINIPEEWVRLSGNKKKVFFNTNISLILNNKELFTVNIYRVFELFNKRKDVFVIWREHPLTYETLKSMKSGIIEDYNKLKEYFVESRLGVIDTNVEAYEAIFFSDCYYGAGGSLVPIYATTGKPMMITAYKYPDNIIDMEVGIETLLKQANVSMHFSERYKNFLDLYLDNYEKIMEYKQKRYELLDEITILSDGLVGDSIMKYVKNIEKLK